METMGKLRLQTLRQLRGNCRFSGFTAKMSAMGVASSAMTTNRPVGSASHSTALSEPDAGGSLTMMDCVQRGGPMVVHVCRRSVRPSEFAKSVVPTSTWSARQGKNTATKTPSILRREALVVVVVVV
jgi:hypothetical protein